MQRPARHIRPRVRVLNFFSRISMAVFKNRLAKTKPPPRAAHPSHLPPRAPRPRGRPGRPHGEAPGPSPAPSPPSPPEGVPVRTLLALAVTGHIALLPPSQGTAALHPEPVWASRVRHGHVTYICIRWLPSPRPGAPPPPLAPAAPGRLAAGGALIAQSPLAPAAPRHPRPPAGPRARWGGTWPSPGSPPATFPRVRVLADEQQSTGQGSLGSLTRPRPSEATLPESEPSKASPSEIERPRTHGLGRSLDRRPRARASHSSKAFRCQRRACQAARGPCIPYAGATLVAEKTFCARTTKISAPAARRPPPGATTSPGPSALPPRPLSGACPLAGAGLQGRPTVGEAEGGA